MLSIRRCFVPRRHTHRLCPCWSPNPTPAPAQPLLTVERQVVGWFGIAPERRRHFAPDQLPVGIIQDERSYFYTFPGDDFGFKVGAYNHL